MTVATSQLQRVRNRAARAVTPSVGAALIALVPAALIVTLLVLVTYTSVRSSVRSGAELTFQNYRDLVQDDLAWEAAGNTAYMTAITMAVSLFFGVSIAWLVERTDLRGKNVVSTLMLIGLLIPGYFVAMGWVLLMHPRIGIANEMIMKVTGDEQGPLNIASVPGMGWVLGLGLASVVFVLVSGSLRAMDSSLEEGAQTSGAGFVSTMRLVTLPLAWPGILASALYTLTIAISSFDIPLVIGLSNRIYVFSTYLNAKMNPSVDGLPRYELAAAFGTVMLALALVLTWWYGRVLKESRKYEVISGKNYRPRLVGLGKWQIAAWLFLAFYFLSSKIMPLAMVIWASLLPFFQPFSRSAFESVSLDAYRDIPRDEVWEGLRHTLVLMFAVPTLAVLMSVVFSWLVLRSKFRFRGAFDFVAFLPHAVPSVVFGFAATIIALFYLGFLDLYGSMTLLVVVMAITFLSFASRISNSAMVQINRELEEAATVAGAGMFTTMRLIVLPLIRPALAYAWIWIALLAFRDLTLPTVLFSRDNITLSYMIWNEWLGGSRDTAAAISVLMLLMMAPFIFVYWRFRGGVETRAR